MNRLAHEQVTPGHLQRLAYLYIRQSSLRQVLENTCNGYLAHPGKSMGNNGRTGAGATAR